MRMFENTSLRAVRVRGADGQKAQPRFGTRPATNSGRTGFVLSAALLAFGLAATNLSTPAFAQQSVETRLQTYRDRVARLEDQNAIENLQALYGYYFDKGMWSEVSDLFSRNGRFEYGQRGVYAGKARIQKSLLLFGPERLASGHLNNHMQLQAVIKVAPDGKTATGRWQGMIMLSEPGANGVWGVGIYENTYVKESGVWKIASLHFYVTGKTDYDAGWMRSKLPMEGQSALFPPDEPPTEVYRSLPSNYIPPFSFDHPVTGKPLSDIKQPKDDIVGRDQ